MAGTEEHTTCATKFEEAFITNAEGELACLSEKVSTEPLHTLVAWWEELGENWAILYKSVLSGNYLSRITLVKALLQVGKRNGRGKVIKKGKSYI